MMECTHKIFILFSDVGRWIRSAHKISMNISKRVRKYKNMNFILKVNLKGLHKFKSTWEMWKIVRVYWRGVLWRAFLNVEEIRMKHKEMPKK